MATADELAAEKIGRAIDGQILKLQQEKDVLTAPPGPRIAAINAELAVLLNEKARIDPRRPTAPVSVPAVDGPAPSRLR